MSKQEVTVTLTKRVIIGKGLNKLKETGMIPAVIHNPGLESMHVSGNFIELTKVYQQAGKHHPVTVDLEGKKYLTIIKDVDVEIRKRQIRHIVFGIIKQNETVETEVPVVFAGDEDSPAQKAGLLVIKQLDTVQVEAFPKDLPDNMQVSIESLVEVGDKITVADIIPQPGVKVLTEAEHSVAVVTESAAQQSADAEAEEAATAAAAASEAEATETTTEAK